MVSEHGADAVAKAPRSPGVRRRSRVTFPKALLKQVLAEAFRQDHFRDITKMIVRGTRLRKDRSVTNS